MSSYNYKSITVQYNSEKVFPFNLLNRKGEPGQVANDQSQALKQPTQTKVAPKEEN